MSMTYSKTSSSNEERFQELIKNPNLLDQIDTNLCGIVAPLKIIIEKRPKSFRTLVNQITNNKPAFGIFPNKPIINNSTPKHFNPLDYLIFSSLRSTLNIFLGYNPITDKGYHGFTWPGDVSWMLKNSG